MSQNPVTVYAADPNRSAVGADQLLHGLLEMAEQAAQLAIELRGDFPNTREDRHNLAVAILRIKEAKLLA